MVHICGALTYTLTVALAGLLARGRATGAAGLRRAGIAVAIMLAPSILGGTEVFLENPDHFGTSVPVLLVLLLLDWGEGRDEVTAPRWYVPVAVGALLAWTQVGDELSLAAATVPIAAVCASPPRDLPRPAPSPRIELRWDGLLAAAALISVAIARIAEQTLRSVGGFDQRPVPGTRLASLGQLPANARVLCQSILLLFGANNPGKPRRALTISQHVPLVFSADFHVIGVLVAGAGLVAGIATGFFGRPRRWPGQDWADRDRVNQILVVAIVVTIAAGLFSTVLQSLTSAHEVAVLLPLGAVLAARTLPPLARPLAAAARRAPGRPAGRTGPADRPAGSGRGDRGHCGAGGVARRRRGRGGLRRDLAALPGAGAEASPPGWSPTTSATAWPPTGRAPQTTVTSGGRVLVAPVTAAGIAAKHWEASSAWYQPSRHRATFVIAEVHPTYAEDALTVASVRARFGLPAAEYHVGGDVVMIYRYNLLTRLHGRAFPGPS